jgi:hypothetical protein
MRHEQLTIRGLDQDLLKYIKELAVLALSFMARVGHEAKKAEPRRSCPKLMQLMGLHKRDHPGGHWPLLPLDGQCSRTRLNDHFVLVRVTMVRRMSLGFQLK